ncbi:MAG: biopolymer transport protein ExbB/TolQ [Rhodothermales bacterium]|jgi:biopolymer transport protein ExbB/TolQ
MRFNCPHCAELLTLEDEYAGLTIECPSCEEEFDAPELGATKKKAPARKKRSPGTTAGSKASSADGKPPKKRRRTQQWSDNADVPGWQGAATGAAFFLLWYGMLTPFQGSYVADLFFKRGWVPFALVFIMGWSFGILLIKLLKMRRQRAAMILDVLPSRLGEEINSENIETFIDHVDKLPERVHGSFMVMRIRRGLEHFSARRNNQEVVQLMGSQSEIDASAIYSSYALIKVFVWAIPILGFVGTVMGISEAISSFSNTLDQADDIEVLMGSIGKVTAGLGVAFDTTLVALVMSLIVSFPTRSMQKGEEDLLNRIDEYCNEKLLKRMNDGGGVADVADHTALIMESIGRALSTNQEDVLSNLSSVVEKMGEVQAAQVRQTAELSEAVTGHLGKLAKAADQQSGKIEDRLGATLVKVEKQSKAAMDKNAESVEAHFERLGTALESLNAVLTSLGKEQVVIQQLPAPKKKGWFSRG